MKTPKYTDNTGSRKRRVKRRLSESALKKKVVAENAAQKAINIYKKEMGI